MTKRQTPLLRVLGDRNAATFLTVSLISGFGSTAMGLAAGIWAKTLTGSDTLSALTMACIWLPLMAGPVLGLVVDRVRRRRLLVVANLALAAALPVLFAVRSAGDLWLLWVVLIGYGAVGVLTSAAEDALLPSVVDGDLLGDLNGLRMTAQEGTKLVAPMAGAALFGWLGGPAVALLDAATFGVAALVYSRLRTGDPRPERTGHDRRITAGAREIRRRPELRRLVLTGGIMMMLSGASTATLYAVVDAGLHRAPTFVGVLAVAQGVGSVLGGFAIGPLLRRYRAAVVAGLGGVLFGAGIATNAVPLVWAVLLGRVAIGVGLPWVIVAAVTVLQRTVPGPLIGRVSATVTMVVFAPTGVATAAGAGLLSLFGLRPLVLATAAAAVLTACVLLALPSPKAVIADGDLGPTPHPATVAATTAAPVSAAATPGGSSAGATGRG
ncbi:MFS transporter [Rhizomonospora bruguierae]|uniref:MFS transporter n=1 Tax=Rhizomonospora bruguierae TaxID=1581705 RepID=UPI001BD04174|nr:MFS transporter [Micromonospora sp. NBRC 107566]